MRHRGSVLLFVGLAVAIGAAVLWRLKDNSTPPPSRETSASASSPPSAPAASPAAAASTPVDGETRLTPPAGYVALSAAFNAGRLPEPAALPRGTPDRQAAALASAVFKSDGNSTAALHAAVLASGYAVRRRDGTLTRTVDPGQGIVLDEFDVAAMAKLYGLGYGATLKHLGDSFRQAPPWKELKLEELLLSGLRDAAQSTRPELKFWAFFVNELGRRSPGPFDLLGEPEPEKVHLDAIQLQFLLTRLAADHAARHQPGTASALRSDVVRASWVREQSAPAAACSPTTFGDYAAVAATTIFGATVDAMGGAAAKYGQAVQKANFVLMLAKFIATYAMLEQDLSIEGGKLTRTKTKEAGIQTTLTDRVSIQETWAQYVNCAREILNSGGLDVTLPESGPVKNVKVWWSIERGRDELVFFPFAQAGPSGGGFSSTKEDGVAKAFITGFGQHEDLSRRRIVQIDKQASVRTSTQVKSTKLENLGDALGTAGDFGSLIIAFFTGDWQGAVGGLITETFYRSAWGYSEPFEFTVTDWEPCKNVWSGKINYLETFVKVGSATRPGINQTSWSEILTYSAQTEIVQSRPDAEPAGNSHGEASLTRMRLSRGLTQCYYNGGQLTNLKGSGDSNAYLSVILKPNGDYTVGYTLPIVDAEGTYNVWTKKQGQCNNPFNMEKSDTMKETGKLGPEGHVEIRGNTKTPDVLTGSRTEKREVRDGVRTATVTWVLQRCPGS